MDDDLTARCRATLYERITVLKPVSTYRELGYRERNIVDVAAACMARAIAHLLPSDAWPEEWDDALAAARGEEAP